VNKNEIKQFVENFLGISSKTMVIVDFANVEKWKENLGWKIGIQELANFVKNFSKGNRNLRRFYYGSDHGNNDKSIRMTEWSYNIIKRAESNGFEIVSKRVKYIHLLNQNDIYNKKCDLDVEMTVDIISLTNLYSHLIIFSGDGDIAYTLRYIKKQFNKEIYVFGARNNIGKELIDLLKEGVVNKILYIEDFEYRLNMDRFRYK